MEACGAQAHTDTISSVPRRTCLGKTSGIRVIYALMHIKPEI